METDIHFKGETKAVYGTTIWPAEDFKIVPRNKHHFDHSELMDEQLFVQQNGHDFVECLNKAREIEWFFGSEMSKKHGCSFTQTEGKCSHDIILNTSKGSYTVEIKTQRECRDCFVYELMAINSFEPTGITHNPSHYWVDVAYSTKHKKGTLCFRMLKTSIVRERIQHILKNLKTYDLKYGVARLTCGYPNNSQSPQILLQLSLQHFFYNQMKESRYSFDNSLKIHEVYDEEKDVSKIELIPVELCMEVPAAYVLSEIKRAREEKLIKY